jgi:hypothetical protein
MAAAGVAFVSFACNPKPDVVTGPSPVGNLRAPDPDPAVLDAGLPDDSGSGPADAGVAPPDAADVVTGPSPVGNLRAPEPVPKKDAGAPKKK